MITLSFKTYVVLIIALVFVACEYELSEDYFSSVNKDVAPPELEVIELNLNNNNDTIYIYSNKEISFDFKSEKQQILGVELLMNGESQQIIRDSQGEFNPVSWYGLEEGFHTLTLNVYTSTGTGSIADQLYMESFLASRSWVVVVDKSFNQKTVETTSNGIFSMAWAECKSFDFKEFVVYKRFEYGVTYEVERLVGTTFTDNTYVGEECTYYVQAITDDNTFSWGNIELNSSIPKLKLRCDTNNSYALINSKGKYTGGIKSLVIEHSTGGYEYDQIKQTTDLNDTIYLIKEGYYGDEAKYRLRVVPKGLNKSYVSAHQHLYGSVLDSRLGYKVDPNSFWLDDVHQVSPDEFIFSGYRDTLKKFSTSLLKITEQNVYPLTNGCSSRGFWKLEASSTGKTLTSTLYCSDEVLYMSTNDFLMDNIKDMDFLTGDRYSPAIPISDVGIGVVSNGSEFYLYDFSQSIIVGRANYHHYNFKINHTATYIYVSGGSKMMLKFNNGIISKIWESDSFSPSFEFFAFDALNSNQAVVWCEKELKIKDCSTFETLHSYPLTDTNLCDIDFYNRRMLTYKDNVLYVRDLEKGTILEEVPVRYYSFSLRWYNRLVGNCIIEHDGFIYFLKGYNKSL